MKLRFITLLTASFLLGNLAMAASLNVKFSNDVKDYTPVIYQFLHENAGDNIELNFEKGTYHFFPEKAYEKYLCISNNDNGLKKIGFPLIDFKSVTIKGNETEFIFHGKMVPFVVEHVGQLNMSGFNLNWDYPFAFEGEVIESNPEEHSFTLKVNPECKYKIEEGELIFGGYDWESHFGDNLLFDKEKHRPYYNTKQYKNWWKLHAKELESGVVKFSGFDTKKTVPPVGTVWVDKGHQGNRSYPAMRLYRSQNINLSNINIYCSMGMALIGENLEGVTMNNFNITLPDGSDRMIGVTADATHFINCKGLITFKNCLFRCMLDDATNVHGTYMKVEDIIDEHTVGVRFHHHQQVGFDFAQAGDSIRFISRTNLQGVQSAVVKKVDKVNHAYYLITIDQPLSNKIDDFTAVENISWMASVYMENCRVEHNRARALLLSTPKKVEIYNSYFSSMMAGIRICGDANFWFESGEVNDLTIKGCTFEDIGVGGGNPQAVLQIDPIIAKKYRDGKRFHSNIVFEDNTIKTFDNLIIYALSVDGLTIKNNTIINSKTYPPIFGGLAQFDIQNCSNVLLEGNKYSGDKPAEISVIGCDNVKLKKMKGFIKKPIEKPNPYFYQN